MINEKKALKKELNSCRKQIKDSNYAVLGLITVLIYIDINRDSSGFEGVMKRLNYDL